MKIKVCRSKSRRTARALIAFFCALSICVSLPGAPPPSKIGAFGSPYWQLDQNGNNAWDGPATDGLWYWGSGDPNEVPVYGDWNGDGRTKIGTYLNGVWMLDFNGNGIWDGPDVDKLVYLGGPGYTPVVGDWNGTSSTKIGAYKDGVWLIDFNGNFAWDGPGTDKLIFFGGPNYAPVVGDWNGLGTTKIGAYLNGVWVLDYNGNWAWDDPNTGGADKLVSWSWHSDEKPMVGNWNGLGLTTKIGVYYQGVWMVDYNGDFVWNGPTVDKLPYFGGPGFTPVVGDWNGDGATKIAAYYNDTGAWLIDINGNFIWDQSNGDILTNFGGSNYQPVVGLWRDLTIDPLREPVTSPPEYQPPPESEPVPTPPPPVSGSANACGDINGNWVNAGDSRFSYSISTSGGNLTGGSTATYTDSCGTATSQLTGFLQTDGTWQVTSPYSTLPSCNLTFLSSTATVASDCSSASVTGSGGSGTQAQGMLALAAQTTTWSRTSNPPGVTVKLDLMTGKITTQLTGQNKTSNLTVNVNNAQGVMMLSTPHYSAQGGNSFSDSFRTLIQAGQQYGSVTATWDTTSLTVPVSFFTIGYTHFTQYNTAYHSSCPGSPQSVSVIYKMDAQYCYYKTLMFGTDFVNSVFVNGTGVYDANGTNTVLKSYAAGAMNVCYTNGFPRKRTFFSVDAGGTPITKIRGGVYPYRVASDGSALGTILNDFNPPPGTLATDPDATNKGSLSIYLRSDAILVFDQNDNNDPRGLRSVQDLCPDCSGQATQVPSRPAHIDVYNGTSTSCYANVVGDYGTGYYNAIRLR